MTISFLCFSLCVMHHICVINYSLSRNNVHCTKWSFPLRISSVNVTKSTGNCGFGHIYRRNLDEKLYFSYNGMAAISLFSDPQVAFKRFEHKPCSFIALKYKVAGVIGLLFGFTIFLGITTTSKVLLRSNKIRYWEDWKVVTQNFSSKSWENKSLWNI